MQCAPKNNETGTEFTKKTGSAVTCKNTTTIHVCIEYDQYVIMLNSLPK